MIGEECPLFNESVQYNRESEETERETLGNLKPNSVSFSGNDNYAKDKSVK